MNPTLSLDDVTRGCETLVEVCADLQPGETAMVISDETTREIGGLIATVASRVSAGVIHRVIKPLRVHGEEPPADIAVEMLESDVIFGVTKMSLAHTHARHMASKKGARYLSLPDYSMAILSSPALQVNFRDLTPQAARIAKVLTAGHEVSVHTSLGTNIVLRIDGRQANSCPGWCDGPGSLASPPDAEANIAPLESSSQGIIVVDGSIPCDEIGLLDTPITLGIIAGRIAWVEGTVADRVEHMLDHLGHPGTRVLAELGIGLNPRAKVCGIMLEDEGCLGTIHMGFGSNATIGGQNSVPFHLDMIIREGFLEVDGEPLMEAGHLLV